MKALVAYASKQGSTAEIAQAIAEELRSHGLDADCREAGEVRRLGAYGAVVLGSAVYMKRWRPSARRFLRQHRASLPGLPWWVFNSGPVGKPSDDPKAAEWESPPKVMATVEALGAREHVVFGGRVPLDPKNFIERSMVKNTPKEFADRRDWEEIRRWAAGIALELVQRGDVSAAA